MVFQASTGISMMRILPAAAEAHIVCEIEQTGGEKCGVISFLVKQKRESS
jgi:hypothetical protein